MEAESIRSPVAEEYVSLMGRSEELFIILRDIPRFGFRQWQVHFLKTFQIFSRLWKLQQEHRTLLQQQVGLKRHSVGEIASKVGQLYYHYYLHTSDLKYLNEAMDFYSAILRRSYFKCSPDKENVEVRIHSLRYLARYFVVALLMKNFVAMREILESMSADVSCLPEGTTEKDDWDLVMKEGVGFLEVLTDITILNDNNETVHVEQRLAFKEAVHNNAKTLKLTSAVLIGGCKNQMKFSELTMDMFRMLQIIEYAPPDGNENATNGEENNINKDKLSASLSYNPSKHLLYKPSFGQINAFLSAVYRDLPDDGVLLLYISSDEERDSDTSKRTMLCSKAVEKHEKDAFYPEDIAPLTRKPLFIIVDLEKSDGYQNIPSLFTEARICLIAPRKLQGQAANRRAGSIFTMFLCEPLQAICRLCGVSKITKKTWRDGTSLIDKIGQMALELLLEENLDIVDSFRRMLRDPFLRNIMSHFFICLFVLRLYKHSLQNSCLPMCVPPIPVSIMNHKVLHRYVLDLLNMLEVRHLFFEHADLPGLEGLD